MAEPLLELLGGSGSCLLPREIRGDAAVILDALPRRLECAEHLPRRVIDDAHGEIRARS